MAKVGLWFTGRKVRMLEGRKLSLEMQRDSHSRIWTLIAILISLSGMVLLASLWIGQAIAPPPADQSQDNMVKAHAQVVESIEKLKGNLASDQAITPELFGEMMASVPVLSDFSREATKGTQALADSRDPQIWPGRANLILEDLNTLLLAKEPLLKLLQTRDNLSALYKPKGNLLPQASAPLTAVRELGTGVAEWVKLSSTTSVTASASSTSSTSAKTKSAPVTTVLTWDLFVSSKGPWQQINAQLDALEGEAKLTDNPAQVKAALALLAALNQSNLIDGIRTTDQQLSKVWTAQERLLKSLESLPPVPQVIVPPAPFSWSQLAFPGQAAEGLMGAIALCMVGIVLLIATHLSHQRHLKRMSQKWLGLTHKLENSLRDVTQPLTASILQQEELVAEFNRLLEQSRLLQQTLSTPLETPQKTLEDQAWSAAARIQADLESELMLLREKFLNIHLQFCSGATHENLVYDLAFTAEGIQTVLTTASDLGRSFAILKEHLQQSDTTGNNQELVALMSQTTKLKSSVKRMTQQLGELSHKLQVAVEDVPDGKRFDGVSPQSTQGRAYGNPSI